MVSDIDAARHSVQPDRDRAEAASNPLTLSHKPGGAITMRRSEFPYAVEIAGHTRGQHAMRDFHARHGMRVHLKHAKHKDGRRYIRWRFASLPNGEVCSPICWCLTHSVFMRLMSRYVAILLKS